jgi:hypothetical protein
MRVLLTVLLLGTPLGAQPLTLPVEIQLSTVEMADLAESGQRPFIASDGSRFLAVWTDRRLPDMELIYASRLTAAGEMLDPLGVRIAEGRVHGVAWVGRAYVVPAVLKSGEPALITLDRDARIVLQTKTRDWGVWNDDPGIASNGDGALMAGTNGKALRIDADGRPLRTFWFAPDAPFWTAAVAAAQRQFLIAYVANGTLYARRVAPDDTVGEPVELAEKAFGIGAASDGESFLVLWTAQGLNARAVSAGGVPEETTHTLQAAPAEMVGVTWRKDAYLVTSALGGQTFEVYANRRGEPLAAPRAFASGQAPDVAAAGDTAAFVWIGTETDIRASISHARGAFAPPRVLTRGPNRQTAVRLVRAEERVIAAWKEGPEIRVAALHGEARVAARTPAQRFDLLSDGSIVWLVWHDANVFRIRRYTSALDPLDAAPTEVRVTGSSDFAWRAAIGAGGIAIASHVNPYHPDNPERVTLFGTVVRIDGSAVTASTVPLYIDDGFLGRDALVAWSGSEYVFAWVQARTRSAWTGAPADPLIEDILAVRVTRDGMVVDPVPLIVFAGIEPTTFRFPVSIEAHGGGVVMVWHDHNYYLPFEGKPSMTYMTVFRGEERPHVRIAPNPAHGELRDAVAVPGGYLFVWRASPTAISLMRMSPALNAIEASRTELGPSNDSRYSAAVVGDRVYVGYARQLTEGEFAGTQRAFVRTTPGPRRRSTR